MTADPDVYKNIKLALQRRLLDFRDDVFAGAVEFDNDNFNPETFDFWLRDNVFYREPVRIGAFTEGTYRIEGVYYPTVVCRFGRGSVEIDAYAGELAAHFSRGLSLTEDDQVVKIEASWRGTAMRNATWYQVPVFVEFWSYTSY